MKDQKLAEKLILDELFDLALYQTLHSRARGDTKETLAKLIGVEEKHVQFWKDFFSLDIRRLNFGRKLKLWVLVRTARIFGDAAVHLILEATEIYGIKKYLSVWGMYRDTPLGGAVKEILEDEFEHEERIVTELIERKKLNPDRIRNIFLGFNDGLVEILGAVSGFFAAFESAASIIVAGLTVAVAGSISMAAGVFAAESSEKEVRRTEEDKDAFLKRSHHKGHEARERPLVSGIIVGISYLIGSLVPVLPVVFGAKNIFISILAAAAVITMVSFILAFLSGMDVKKRIGMNFAILAVAVSVTYGIGVLARAVFGVNL